MKKHKRVLATLFLLVLLGIVLWLAAKRCYEMERNDCFERLTGYTEQVANEILRTVEGDRRYLAQVADMFGRCDLTDTQGVAAMLSTLGGIGTVVRLELLLPGDRLITRSGEPADLSGQLSFQAEAWGPHISRRCSDPLSPDRMILRYFTPVEQDGQTAAVLCGVVELERLTQLFSVESYRETMQLYLVEGKTGCFLLDTWHSELGSIADLGGRQTKPGYYWKDFVDDMAEGKAGTLVFLSRNAGEYFYTYSSPVGIEDWMVSINVAEGEAFAQAENMMRSFYGLAALLLAFFLLYFIWILWDVRWETAAREKQLRHVRYMLDVEKELFDAHMHPERFAAALQTVADFLNADTAFFWLAEGQPDISRRLWSSRDDVILEQDPDLLRIFPDLFPVLKKKGSLLRYHTDSLVREFPVGGAFLTRFHVQSLMLIPVSGLGGELAMVLGACNLHQHWETVEPLEQVSLSFSMAINHYGAYQSLNRMGQVDSLTGLLNRNSYSTALAALSADKPDTLACVYIDANGLHEINNHLGHQAGDEMLKAVAEVLRRFFSQQNVYRIGGDEFVALCRDWDREDVYRGSDQACEALSRQGYEISVGIAWRDRDIETDSMIRCAEEAMQQDKQRYYQRNGGERQMRSLDRQLEQMLLEKQDADVFLSVLAHEFKGVYFVDLDRDTIRHLYIPPYFKAMLREVEGAFSAALILYARRIVKPEYLPLFQRICDYSDLEGRLCQDVMPEFTYQKLDGEWLNLRVLKFKDYGKGSRETLWIFAMAERPL